MTKSLTGRLCTRSQHSAVGLQSDIDFQDWESCHGSPVQSSFSAHALKPSTESEAEQLEKGPTYWYVTRDSTSDSSALVTSASNEPLGLHPAPNIPAHCPLQLVLCVWRDAVPRNIGDFGLAIHFSNRHTAWRSQAQQVAPGHEGAATWTGTYVTHACAVIHMLVISSHLCLYVTLPK